MRQNAVKPNATNINITYRPVYTFENSRIFKFVRWFFALNSVKFKINLSVHNLARNQSNGKIQF